MARYLANELQNEWECTEFVKLLVAEGVRSYLEIGSRYGGSLWRVAEALPASSKLVAVDIADTDSLRSCITDASAKFGHEIHLIVGDSRNPGIVKHVSSLGPFDVVLIDGDHHIDAVANDWRNYGSQAKIVVFHDIGPAPPHKPWKTSIPAFWDDLKKRYKYREILAPKAKKAIGFGVIWRHST
jgi:predicted O-methyltransferase YrrM